VQRRVLERTREKLARVETELKELEEKSGCASPQP
jgi:BMFP domain-containing protein YqiC